MKKEYFILRLHDIGAIKFGEFTLKSGQKSPFYFDLRDMISHPELLSKIAYMIVDEIKDSDFDYISGVPYTALPIATLVADILDKPLLFIRKEEKAYGTKNDIVGKFEPGGKCLIIDDLITTGESLIETAEKFKKAGLIVADFFVIIDRSNNIKKHISNIGYNLHSLIELDKITEVLKENNRITVDQKIRIKEFTKKISYENKPGKSIENHLTKLLKAKIQSKKSNLILSLDIDNQKEFFIILQKTAKHIVMLKTHIDIINDFTPEFIVKLKEFAIKYDFMIFEDRKFADIGNTVKKQYYGGIFKIKNWAHFITVHTTPGEGILQGLFGETNNRSSFLLAKMSSAGNLMNETYTRKTFEIGEKYADVVSGYICHATEKEKLKLLKNKIPKGQLMLVPGVKTHSGADAVGQQYITIKDAVEGGADCIIAGRGITEAENPEIAAKMYKEQAWKIYSARETGI